MWAASAISSQTSRERMARCQHSPACCPVMVMSRIADRGAIGMCVAVDDDYALAQPRGCQRMCSPQMPARTMAMSNGPGK